MNSAQKTPTPANPTDLMTAAIQQQLMSNLNNPAFMNTMMSQVMISLGNVLRATGHQSNPDVGMDSILTPPALLEGDITIVLTNKAKLLPGSFRLLATDIPVAEDQATRSITLFIENDNDLSASQIVNLTPEQGGEIMRQLAAIGHQGTRLYHVHVVAGKIDGFPYFRPEQSSEETGGSESSTPQDTQVNAGEAKCEGSMDTLPGDPTAGLIGEAIPGDTVVTTAGGAPAAND